MSIISEVSETLSLTNKPKQLLETALDTLSEVLNTDCCWIQLVTSGGDKLPVFASRGFTPDMQREMASIDPGHRFNHEIVGLGHKIIIPNLSKDGHYDISVFEKAGFRSLIAVPIMTYRIHGVLGVAYRVRKRLDKDFPKLLTVIANLIGMSLNKSMLHKQPIEKKEPLGTSHPLCMESSVKSGDTQSRAIESEDTVDTRLRHQSETDEKSGDFHDHTHRMRVFRRSHKAP